MMANIVCRCVEDAKGSHADVVRGLTTAKHNESQHEKSDPFHGVLLCALRVVAREFLTSATNSSI